MNIDKNPAYHSYYFSIHLNEEEKSVNCSINNLVNNETTKYGYLELNKYKIFVWMVDCSELYQTKRRSKTFKFIYKSNCSNYLPDIHYLSPYNYRYKDGHFFVDTLLPSPMQ